jgi:hypothetical protein
VAANDELPRGVTLSASSGASSGVTVTFPASPGISWVLTDIDVICWSGSGSPGHYLMGISTSLGTPVAQIAVDNNTGTAVTGEWTWSGKVAGALGAALTVTITNVANVASDLTCQAYPI